MKEFLSKFTLGCLGTVGFITVVSAALIGGVFATNSLRDWACLRNTAEVITVRVGQATLNVPADLQPIFVESPGGPIIRSVRNEDGRNAYCPARSRVPAQQRAVAFNNPPFPHMQAIGVETRNLEAVRTITLHVDGFPPGQSLQPGHAFGPAFFGRPTTYFCSTGGYGPGRTCHIEGRTPDGLNVRASLQPIPEDEMIERPMRTLETLVTALQDSNGSATVGGT